MATTALIQVAAPTSMAQRLAYAALREGRPRSEILRDLIDDYLTDWRDPATGEPIPPHIASKED